MFICLSGCTDYAPKKSTAYKWIKRFEEGREGLKDDKKGERPASIISTAGFRKPVEEDRGAMVEKREDLMWVTSFSPIGQY